MVLKKDLKMAKQVVTEVRNGDSVKITLSYEFEPALIGKKERQEVVVGNITKYWVYVPEEIEPVYQTWEDKQEVIAKRRQIKAEKKQKVLSKLQEEKNERIARYAKMAQLGELFTGKLVPTDEDLESARKLQSISVRAQNKKLCKLA